MLHLHKFLHSPALCLVLAIFAASTHAGDKNLFGNERQQTSSHNQQMMNQTTINNNDDEESAVSVTDAAQRAQQRVDGKVMNVRKYKDEEKTLYGVKVLQKNGRIKTINVDADKGNIVE